jgi:hypothetical protein
VGRQNGFRYRGQVLASCLDGRELSRGLRGAPPSPALYRRFMLCCFPVETGLCHLHLNEHSPSGSYYPMQGAVTFILPQRIEHPRFTTEQLYTRLVRLLYDGGTTNKLSYSSIDGVKHIKGRKLEQNNAGSKQCNDLE